MNSIASNLARLRDTITTVARSAQRDPEEIKLVAVSKTHSIESISVALAAGQQAFGENTVQEALPKIAHFAKRERVRRVAPTNEIEPARRVAPTPASRVAAASEIVPEWHFIGHLQSNKVRFVPGSFSWIHSVDSVKLARRLSQFAQDQATVINALIEVNITDDPRKHGVAPQDVVPLLDQLLRENLAGLLLGGLMTIGPYPASELEIRRAYAGLRELRDDCATRFGLKDFDQLSMGMSGDYVQAIQEGATLLRIGTAIFGERLYGDGSRPQLG